MTGTRSGTAQQAPAGIRSILAATTTSTISDESIIVINDLKVNRRSIVVQGDDNIDCKIDGIGPMRPKWRFVHRAKNAG